jgi:hypothetical protein
LLRVSSGPKKTSSNETMKTGGSTIKSAMICCARGIVGIGFGLMVTDAVSRGNKIPL